MSAAGAAWIRTGRGQSRDQATPGVHILPQTVPAPDPKPAPSSPDLTFS